MEFVDPTAAGNRIVDDHVAGDSGARIGYRQTEAENICHFCHGLEQLVRI